MITLLLSLALVPADTTCIWNQSTMPGRGVLSIPDARRTSPRDSLTFQAGGATVKVCYSGDAAFVAARFCSRC